jgi:DNA-binding NarL/FixJ family response regulator
MPTTSADITVSLVEDNAGMRESLAALLQRTPGITCVSQHGSAEDALEKIPGLQPRVVLVDINLPGLSGIECVARLKPLLPRSDLLMLTVHEEAEAIFNSLRAGATGYLLKTVPLKEIVAGIQEAMEGGVAMSAAVARRMIRHFNEMPKTTPTVEQLTPREEEILELLAKGLINKEIADCLSVSTGTVRNHLERMYRKLHVSTRTEAVLKYLGRG